MSMFPGSQPPPVIVIPMAGLSRRFADAGYNLPKYMLNLRGRSVFAHAIASFQHYFATSRFLFGARDILGARDFIISECAALSVSMFDIHVLDSPTGGQAETVALTLNGAGVAATTPVTVFNIDTFRPGFRYPDAPWWCGSQGYLEVFRGSGAGWSYVLPANGAEPRVRQTAEKRPISDLCSTGLYYFAEAAHFHTALSQERQAPSAAELYVAPLYNHLIAAGLPIHYNLIDTTEVVFCGVPTEYETLAGQTTALTLPTAQRSIIKSVDVI